jgi:hypothetical protein
MVWSRLIVLCRDIVHRFSRQLLDCLPCLSLHKIYAYLTSSGSCTPLGTVFAFHAYSLGIGGPYHLISAVSSITKSFMACVPCVQRTICIEIPCALMPPSISHEDIPLMSFLCYIVLSRCRRAVWQDVLKG